MKVGFIGVGNMGNPMAQNLIKAGHTLLVHDLKREAARNLEDMGAAWVNRSQETTTGTEAVFTSLPMPADVEKVVLGEDGILAGMAAGATIIDMSTNSPTMVRRLADKVKEKRVNFLDAPVSGGVRGARNATLAVMVGGDKEVYNKFEPLLKAIGSNVFHVGDSGAGNVAKLVNNMMAFINMLGAIEGLVLGAKAGMDPHTLWQVVKAGSGNSFLWESGGRAILRDRLLPTFTAELACKDIGLASSLAEEFGVPLKMGALAQELLRQYRDAGFGKEDILATVKELEKQAGVTVRGFWQD